MDRSSFVAEPTTPAKVPESFRINRFVAAPTNSNGGGRSQIYTLPLLLPPEFQLSVEIQATASALRRFRLLGLSVQTAPGAGDQAEIHAGSPGTAKSWHPVEISRRAGQLRLTVDGKASILEQHAEVPSQWLTIEPAPRKL